ncbi:MerR family transcriptional regulator [Anaerofustis stercorihominis]|uniref:Transcriptional regulator, MerR family n=1 Tax=Anaerofustis stercorihominis DSM 17244 TaxID=445971 RepID=B1C6W9_9FIRM|nr:MerR family transcriptional regulator [Anaerofustis stercorihominis]EDS72756.1 transcriptional regulator, MerR family [Anaerofustis stercorihominis DSM 17244]MCQ4794126.1 MerR family transcriptional regulator [Anaerofustis stercorihominis]
MNTYKTSEIAKIVGIHPNTVRLYEEIGFIPKVNRLENGYRVFTDLHIKQFKIARRALSIEVLQNGLRKRAIEIITTSAKMDYDKSLMLVKDYINQLDMEINNAEEAITITKKLLNQDYELNGKVLKRKEVSALLDISIDTLRNWEMNGLIKIKRKENGYRIYNDEDIRKLKIIRTLRCANYSLSSILRMLNELSVDPDIDIKEVIGMRENDEDIITACDKLLKSLSTTKVNALIIKEEIAKLKIDYKNNPPL